MNKISPKPKVGDYVKILKGVTTTATYHEGKTVKVTIVKDKKDSRFDWCIGTSVPNCGGLWPDEFIIVSSISKSQKQHILDLIKSI